MPPSAKGFQIARVVSLSSDPAGDSRILIALPQQGRGTNEEVWAKIARADAGNKRGIIFLPEIGDEVLVGFINNDNNSPIVIGTLNGINYPSPLQAADDNPEKGIFTRSGLRIYFNDAEKKVIIDTPAGNSIELNESNQDLIIKDMNGNKITMNATGMHYETPGDINIKAGGTISISGAAIKMQALGTTEINGSVLKLQGQEVAELTGTIVKIN
jgi:uncharacterized protein involved in type VI secretion and phage assembly